MAGAPQAGLDLFDALDLIVAMLGPLADAVQALVSTLPAGSPLIPSLAAFGSAIRSAHDRIELAAATARNP